MKKLKKLKLPKPSLKRPLRRLQQTEERASEAFSAVPRITNETVAEHREEVLSSARKYIYPLQHSKHRVVRISLSLLAAVIIGFFVYCGVALYNFQATSGFMYDVTRVIPFPVAKAGPSWVSYESYLFELRRNMHYYRTQQQADFSTKDGKNQLTRLKEQAMGQVVQDAYVKQLAAKNHVSVSDREVSDEVTIVRSQNRLGSNDRVFRDVLSQFWGWSEDDFRRELKQQLLQQKVVAALDTTTNAKAQNALKQLDGGGDFAALAGQLSEDGSTKGNGGQYPNAITQTARDVSPQITAVLFRLQPGQHSPIINTGYSLEIVKLLDISGDSRHAAHIQFNYQDISVYLKGLEATQKSHRFIKV